MLPPPLKESKNFLLENASQKVRDVVLKEPQFEFDPKVYQGVEFKEEVCKLEDGELYIGEWSVSGKEPEGRGILSRPGFRYEGEFRKGKPSGYGRGIFEDGSYYLGYWKNGKKEGKGKL